MMRKANSVTFLAALLAGLAPGSPAQEPAPTIRKDVSLVLVDATVKDRAGHPMKELKQADFQIYDGGTQQEVAHFSRDRIPLAVALVVDLSGSIEPFLRPLRYAAISALRTLKPEDEVALITFTSDSELRVPLTRDKQAVSTQIELFTAVGSTNINDAVWEAARYLRDERPNARRVVLLISDNVATGTFRHRHSQVVNEALAADAAVYNIKVPGQNPGGPNLLGKAFGMGVVNIKELTADTGGEIFDVQKDGSVYISLAAAIDRLKTRYTLGFYPSGQSREAGFRTLDVRLQPAFGSKGSDYSIVAKKGYYSQATRTAGR